MKLRQGKGGTLSLIASCVLVLLIIGFAIFFLAKIMGGSKQVANATDAGAISAAKQLQAVYVDLNLLAANFTSGAVPNELSGLAVDLQSGAPAPAGSASTQTTWYNIYAYNRAVGAALLVCANAQYEGTANAMTNAGNTVSDLQVIGEGLTTQLQNAIASGGNIWQSFQNTSTMNNTNLMGPGAGSTASLLAMQPAYVGINESTQVGKSNIYFNSQTTNSWLGPQLEALTWGGAPPNAGSMSNTNASFATPVFPLTAYQAGQPFVPGYEPFTFNGQSFYAATVNPDQFPHLVSQSRFNSGSAASAAIPKTPFNCLGSTTQAQETNKTNLFISAMASAVIGSMNNIYPAVIQHGFVLLTNDHPYRYNAGAVVGALQPATLDQFQFGGQTGIFNHELYQNVAQGGGGAIDVFAASAAPDGVVFGVEAGPTLFDAANPQSTPADIAMGNLVNQVETWWAYPFQGFRFSSYIGSVGNDPYGHDPKYDPTGGLLTGNPGDPNNLFNINHLPLWQPNDNARVAPPAPYPPPGTQDIVQASMNDMASINPWSVSFGGSAFPLTPLYFQPCSALMYSMFGTPPLCGSPRLQDFEASFGELNSVQAAPFSPDSGYPSQATQGLTSLEYLKGLVITAFVDVYGLGPNFGATIPSNPPVSPAFQYPTTTVINGVTVPICSGSRIYDRNRGYAQPTNTFGGQIPNTIEFGKNGTPYALLQQIADGGSSTSPNEAVFVPTATTCPGDIDLSAGSPLWTAPTSIQGQLLQRVQEIDPTQTASALGGIGGVLNKWQSNLDLGWSDVIFFDDRPASQTYNTLTMAVYDPTNAATIGNFPLWLQAQLQAMTTNYGTSSGSLSCTPDGVTPTPSICANQPLDLTALASPGGNGGMGSIVNAAAGINGNLEGDYDVSDSPFNTTTGMLGSADGATWIPSSGGHSLAGQGGGLLGQLLFQQAATDHVDGWGNPINPFLNGGPIGIPNPSTLMHPN